MSNLGQIFSFVVAAIVAIILCVFQQYYAAPFAFAVIAGIGTALFPTLAASPRPDTLKLQSSQYGGVIPVVYGTRKVAGNCLWYGNYVVTSKKKRVGKKKVRVYTYSVSMAWGLCLNTAASNGDYAGTEVTRLWVGKNEKDLAQMIADDEIRIYNGLQTEPDSHMASFVERAPAYKGLCWVVFPNYRLGSSPYVPNFIFEISGVLNIDTITSYRTHFLTSEPITEGD